jgi:hypothetical protein
MRRDRTTCVSVRRCKAGSCNYNFMIERCPEVQVCTRMLSPGCHTADETHSRIQAFSSLGLTITSTLAQLREHLDRKLLPVESLPPH